VNWLFNEENSRDGAVLLLEDSVENATGYLLSVVKTFHREIEKTSDRESEVSLDFCESLHTPLGNNACAGKQRNKIVFSQVIARV
jgi:hypothetical protein